MEGVVRAWGKILAGYRPNLSIEITRECPLRCPGCYAYGDEHLGGGVTLREVRDRKGQALVDGVLALVDAASAAPPLDRWRRAAGSLSRAEQAAAHPRRARRLHAGRDQRRAADPAGMGRACAACRCACRSTVCSPSMTSGASRRPTTASSSTSPGTGSRCTARSRASRRSATGYLEEFVRFWSENPDTKHDLDQPLHAAGRRAIGRAADRPRIAAGGRDAAMRCACDTRSCRCRKGLINALAEPPQSPDECIFARTTECISADFVKRITPCQFGGTPDCYQCGCIASAGLAAVGRHRVGGVPI